MAGAGRSAGGGTGLVINGTGVSLGVQVETVVLYDEVTDDLRLAIHREEHGLALAFGRACGRKSGNRGGLPKCAR